MLDLAAIAGRIRKLRGNLSQRAFAEKLNFKQTYISQIETGKTKPSLELLLALRLVFGADIGYIICGDQIIDDHFYDPLKIAIHDFAEKVKEIKETETKPTIMEPLQGSAQL